MNIVNERSGVYAVGMRKSLIARGHRGFSTMEVTVALGLLAVLAVAAATLMRSIGGQQGAIVARDEASEFVSALSLWMSTEKGCQAALAGKPVTPGGDFSPIQIDGFKGYGVSPEMNDGSTTLGAGYKISKTLIIRQIRLKDKGVPATSVKIDGTQYRRVVAQTELELEMKTDKGEQGMRKRYIEVPVLLHGTNNVIDRCTGEATLGDICSAIGATPDPATGACKPAVNCTMQGTYMDLSCSPSEYGCFNASGRPLNNPITNSQSCPAGSVASQTGLFNYSHQVGCGKKCVLTVSDTLTFYVCMRCN
jgi:hypothetical protein